MDLRPLSQLYSVWVELLLSELLNIPSELVARGGPEGSELARDEAGEDACRSSSLASPGEP
jgi:hypothetical protein